MNTVIYHKDGTVNITKSGIESIENNLKPGFYQVEVIPSLFGNKVELTTKEVTIPTSALPFAREKMDFDYLKKLFSDRSKQIHKDLNIAAKVGYLFHGKQGSGKTTIIQAASQVLINEMDACVFIVSNMSEFVAARRFIKTLREDSDFVAVILWDECEQGLKDHERSIKPMLDGIEALDNTVIMCSTNYINKIPSTIKDRPSRFKYVIQIDNIEHEDLVYSVLQGMNGTLTTPLTEAQVKSITPDCVGMTIDGIKNVFMDKCFAEIDLTAPPAPVSEPEIKSTSLLDQIKDYGFGR